MRALVHLMSLFLLCLNGASYALEGEGQDDYYHISVKESEIYFKGEMTEASLKDLMQELDQTGIKELRFSSGGGQAIPSIEFGNYLFDNDINVTLAIGCASACANYVFPIAKKVYVERGTLIAWHGGAESDESDMVLTASKEQTRDMVAELEKYIEFWRDQERALYSKAGICWAISSLVVGEKDPRPWYRRFYKKIEWWTWDRDSLLSLGVQNVTFEDEVVISEIHYPAVEYAVVRSFKSKTCPDYQN